jgi:hypothetical protein
MAASKGEQAMNPQYEAHERLCKSIGAMAKENEDLKHRVTELENSLRALWDKLEWERKFYDERIRELEIEAVSDHIPDVTKMIGETPRTDAEAFLPHDSKHRVCDADFTRQLERELNAAQERISKLYDYVAALETGGDLMAHELGFGYDVDLWNKARGEAKP